MDKIKHIHHVIPKHAGGTDNPDNLVELSVEEHALAHKKLYEEHGRWQDRVAWLSLAGIIDDAERIYEIAKNSNKGNPTKYKHNAETREKIRQTKLGEKNPMFGKISPIRGAKRPGIGGRKKGTTWSVKERELRMARMQEPGYFDYTKTPEFSKAVSRGTKGRIGSAKRQFRDNEVPEGFVHGRLNKKQ